MSTHLHRVGIVVDRSFGDRIPALARSLHVWVVDSALNTPVIKRFWQTWAEDDGTDADPLATGVTSFQEASPDESPEAMCLRISGDVAEHHDEYAHDPPWSAIEVYGTILSPALEDAFRELGATQFEPTTAGFVCRR